ncbi:hypothetical protein FB547_104318 [Variovorax beijingensis]|uniref:Uncharacterized protein n=1 Tax=Variovorax beijingensis TaxID=2496117 RepID=A0A561C5P5_9BURK|nr:retron Ec48 family effector membrane protein [Variovorax beijingensis]TWD86374.1 hypothetical protein FB547_104318 [Variovorax beijingensis]
MNKLKKLIANQSPSVVVLGLLIAIILIGGLLLSAAVIVATSFEKELFRAPFCLSNACVAAYLESTGQGFLIAKATFDIGVAIATIGGIFVALVSYFTTSNNTALTNHIEHLKVFGEYLVAEINKRDRLSGQNIDTLLLYGTIFSQSRVGKTTVSEEYKQFIETLNLLIQESNERSVVGTPGGFSYMDHQRRIKDHMAKAGIAMYMAPRNDYFEMETQLFSLLNRISQSFCPPKAVPHLIKSSYY